MLDPRLLFGLLIGLTLCVSLWRISIQEPQLITEYTSITSANMEIVGIANDTFPLNVSTIMSLDLMPPDDLKRLIDLNDFEYSLNHGGCSTDPSAQSPLAIILIHSAPLNQRKRNVIRDTWAKEDWRARIFFLVGSVNSTKVQTKLEGENRIHDDIIQGSFMDTYRNMTYKHIMAFKWFIYNCPKVRYLVKTDDDVFVNTPYLFEYLETKADAQNFLFCFKVENARIKRTYRSKWRVSPKEFPGRYYPPYCPGFSIIYSADAAWRLYNEAQRTGYFWIDDVHVTGTLAQKVNLNITTMGRGKYYMTGPKLNKIFEGNLNMTDPTFIFADPDLVEKQIRTLWKVVLPNNSNFVNKHTIGNSIKAKIDGNGVQP